MKHTLRGLALAASLLAASCSTAPPPAPPEPEVGVVRIPLTLEKGMAWVNASAQGKPLRLLVDLGGFDAVALTPEELKGLEPAWTGREKVTFSAMGQAAKAREFELADFEVGGIKFPKVRGYEDLLHGKNRADSRSGYLGLGILRKFRVIIDYSARLLVLIWPDAPAPRDYDVANWPTIPFARSSDGVITRAKIEGVERQMVWDTGASHCVLKSGLHGDAAVRKMSGHLFVTVNSFEVVGREAGPMDFALLDFKEPRADGFIGFPYFVHHAVYIDFRNELLAIKP